MSTRVQPEISEYEIESQKRPWFIYVVTIFSAMGGFLIGYDTEVVSGAIIIFRKNYDLSSTWQETIVSSTIATAWVFSPLTGLMADYFGRKPVTLMASFTLTLGAILMAFSYDEYMLLSGRIIVGAGVGISSMSGSMYIGEIAPSDIRGRLVTLNNIFLACGMFIASIVCGIFSTDFENGWRFMFGLGAVPSIIQFVAFLMMPETPQWLISKNRNDEAFAVLRKLRGDDCDITREFQEIVDKHQEETKQQESSKGIILLQVLRNQSLRRALVLGCLLQIFQQLCGINTVRYYSATVIQTAGFHDPSLAIWLSTATAAVNFFLGFTGVYLVERIGRRALTLVSLMGMIVCLALLSFGFYFIELKSPNITSQDIYSFNSTCYQSRTCTECVTDPQCGYCFNDTGVHPFHGMCSLANPEERNAISGDCIHQVKAPLTWAYDWCPTSHSWIVFFAVILYLCFYAPGMGPMPWTINAEIFPLWCRSTCISVSTSFNWLFNWAVTMSFLTLTEEITKYGTFALYAGLSVLGWIIFYFMLPETKGRSLEEVETLFSKSWLINRKRNSLPLPNWDNFSRNSVAKSSFSSSVHAPSDMSYFKGRKQSDTCLQTISEDLQTRI